ncbi:MAG: hypothetical protein JST79_15670 [Acidobacteria bacterium]|jgi:hypothetical protein|nr:hypothetical protein [Acidobacteriota bacterium]
MKHFNETQWADFARKLAPPAKQAAMQAHLQAGCPSCAAILQTWESVVALAKEERDLSPPEDAVRMVKSQFAVASALAEERVRLVFDSFLQPATAGVRGAFSARQYLFETDELYIDLRLDSQAERMRLVGQIMERATTSPSVQDLPIHLHQGTLPLSKTRTNQFGEFQMEFEPGMGLRLSILLNEGHPIVLPLYETPVPKPENGTLS